jgi:hypothetical protein
MARPRRHRVLTVAPAHSAAAREEWQAGIETFLEWANRARTGATSQPAAGQCNEALTAFSEGRFHCPFTGLSLEAVLAGIHVLRLVRDGHWHLQRCAFCDRWMLVKDRRYVCCRRVECVRAAKRVAKRRERAAPASRSRRARRPF